MLYDWLEHILLKGTVLVAYSTQRHCASCSLGPQSTLQSPTELATFHPEVLEPSLITLNCNNAHLNLYYSLKQDLSLGIDYMNSI